MFLYESISKTLCLLCVLLTASVKRHHHPSVDVRMSSLCGSVRSAATRVCGRATSVAALFIAAASVLAISRPPGTVLAGWAFVFTAEVLSSPLDVVAPYAHVKIRALPKKEVWGRKGA